MSELISVLTADGPHPDYPDALMLFGRFVGSWDLNITLYDFDGNVSAEGRGEWIFGWILEGRGVQDVLIRPPRAERTTDAEVTDFWEYGSTVRIYDPATDTWRVTWFAGRQGRSVSLIARADGDDIVLDGDPPDDILFRWTFTDIAHDTCTWRGHGSDDGGETWLLLQKMKMQRAG